MFTMNFLNGSLSQQSMKTLVRTFVYMFQMLTEKKKSLTKLGKKNPYTHNHMHGITYDTQ